MDGRTDKPQNKNSPLDCKWAKIGIPETSSEKRTNYELCTADCGDHNRHQIQILKLKNLKT